MNCLLLILYPLIVSQTFTVHQHMDLSLLCYYVEEDTVKDLILQCSHFYQGVAHSMRKENQAQGKIYHFLPFFLMRAFSSNSKRQFTKCHPFALHYFKVKTCKNRGYVGQNQAQIQNPLYCLSLVPQGLIVSPLLQRRRVLCLLLCSAICQQHISAQSTNFGVSSR